MASLKAIRARIKTAKNIQQITRAMKLVAAARLKKATDRVLEARPYSEKLRELMLSMSAAGELPPHPLMAKRPVERYALILITAERGLAGSYNTSLIRKAADFVKETPGEPFLVTVGKKGTTFFGKRGFRMGPTHTVPTAGARLEDAVQVTQIARELYVSGEVDAVYICYSKFYSAIRQVPQVVQLLPIEPPASEEPGSAAGDVIFEPSPAELLNTLLPRYFQGLVWQAMLEATASEHGARMTAMTSATDNAGKMIQNLTLKANRERQAGITKEILEVVSGAEALNA
ncbi:MAG TPA: ATP synthase F1 subunit gamma [Fimbriimonadaceae bacterium]|nr:ATP synthase F1 subunit gamma [Fimbriimonadaceae bacterium]